MIIERVDNYIKKLLEDPKYRAKVPIPVKDNLDPLDLMWLAGLLEGEGCFRLKEYHRKTGFAITLNLGMTDLDVVRKAASIMNSSVLLRKSRDTKRKPCYTTGFSGAPALMWMLILYPYMGERRKMQINNCCKIIDLPFSQRCEIEK